MTYRMKYVIVDYAIGALPIVFSEMQQHANVAYAFGASKDKVIGAGFCQLAVEETGSDIVGSFPVAKFVCFGESISLGVKSREEEDSKLLNKMFGII